jgi:phosphatidate phosphatase APP1
MRIRPPAPVNKFCVRAFDGYGSSKRIYLTGMVIEKGGIVRTSDSDSAADNLRKMVCRFFSRPGPHMDVIATFGSYHKCVRSNDRGYFCIDISPQNLTLAEQNACQVILKLVDNPKAPCATETAKIFIPPKTAKFGVISDIDDTILYTRATNRFRMILIILFKTPYARLTFPAASSFYRALQDSTQGGVLNPFFYVTSSSWRMHDMMHDFMSFHDFPIGPIIMRTIRMTRASVLDPNRHYHKLMSFQQIIETYPNLPFLLIGDSGQKDPEIYAEIIRRFPGRILAVYIRDVYPTASRRKTISEIARKVSSGKTTLLLVKDTMEAARHAASMGWIDPARLSEINHQLLREKQVRPTLSISDKIKTLFGHQVTTKN